MNRFFVLLLFMLPATLFSQAPHIPPQATVYIEPMDGYETYLAAAFAKKHVPLILVADKDKADYVIRSNVSQKAPTAPAVVIINNNVNNGQNNAGSHGGYPHEALSWKYGDAAGHG